MRLGSRTLTRSMLGFLRSVFGVSTDRSTD
jgi:hypothetical protein